MLAKVSSFVCIATRKIQASNAPFIAENGPGSRLLRRHRLDKGINRLEPSAQLPTDSSPGFSGFTEIR